MRKLKNEELSRKSIADFRNAEKTPIIIVLDNVRSALNVGSVFRTADAFLLEAVYLCGITAQPPNCEIKKTALGATETVSWKFFKNTLDGILQLKEMKYKIISVEQAVNSLKLNEFFPDKSEKLAIVFGNEVAGVEQAVVNLSDHVLEIPQSGTKHSLNISVCAGIVCWDLILKLNKQH